jgi:hypothetical protein
MIYIHNSYLKFLPNLSDMYLKYIIHNYWGWGVWV